MTLTVPAVNSKFPSKAKQIDAMATQMALLKITQSLKLYLISVRDPVIIIPSLANQARCLNLSH